MLFLNAKTKATKTISKYLKVLDNELGVLSHKSDDPEEIKAFNHLFTFENALATYFFYGYCKLLLFIVINVLGIIALLSIKGNVLLFSFFLLITLFFVISTALNFFNKRYIKRLHAELERDLNREIITAIYFILKKNEDCNQVFKKYYNGFV